MIPVRALCTIILCFAVTKPIMGFLQSPLLSHSIAVQHVCNRAFKGQLYASNEQKLKQKKFNRQSDESGAAIGFKNVNIAIGSNELISDVNWSILPRERWTLIGKNGAGKSTLLKSVIAAATGDTVRAGSDGLISIAKNAKVGYLEQKGVSGSTRTVKEEVASRMERLQLASEQLEVAENRVSEGDISDAALEGLETATAEFEFAGGYTAGQTIASVLKGLGFVETDNDRLCSEFSGGWQMRIALARLLLSEPDLLILDEPTNHLDKSAREWLAAYLAAFDGTLLLVSHDTALLEKAANSIAEVRNGRLELYKSRTHAQWLVEREERVKLAQTQYEANQREIERLQVYVDRFGAKTMGASLAQSKLKTIAKLTESGPQAPVRHDGPGAFLKLPTPPRGSKVLLKLDKVMLAWKQAPKSEYLSTPSQQQALGSTQPTTSAAPIITDCSITIERGMRIAVRGPNGAGKSTLLSALSGKLCPAAGHRIEGDGLALGVFTQDLAQDLDQSARAVDVVTRAVRQYDSSISDEQARAALGALGLVKEKALRVVGQLSGGEKARVALASFALTPHNLLLLDEPSNHLDAGTIKVLTKALRTFSGACLVISHDREFLEALEPTHVITVCDGRVNMMERGLQDSDWEHAA